MRYLQMLVAVAIGGMMMQGCFAAWAELNRAAQQKVLALKQKEGASAKLSSPQDEIAELKEKNATLQKRIEELERLVPLGTPSTVTPPPSDEIAALKAAITQKEQELTSLIKEQNAASAQQMKGMALPGGSGGPATEGKNLALINAIAKAQLELASLQRKLKEKTAPAQQTLPDTWSAMNPLEKQMWREGQGR